MESSQGFSSGTQAANSASHFNLNENPRIKLGKAEVPTIKL